MKSIKILAIAGLVAGFGASEALAWSGDLIKCNPTPGTKFVIGFSGLTCKEAKVKVKAKTDIELGEGFDGCVANAAAPWDAWVDGKWGKTSAADAALIEQFAISLKGSTFGSCNFGGSDISSGASGAGSLTFFNAAGDSKIKGAALKFFGTVAGNTTTFQGEVTGLVTKGLGLGGDISLTIGLDFANPASAEVVACNLGATCTDPNDPNDPGNVTPAEAVGVQTSGTSVFLLSLGDDDPNDPNDYYALP